MNHIARSGCCCASTLQPHRCVCRCTGTACVGRLCIHVSVHHCSLQDHRCIKLTISFRCPQACRALCWHMSSWMLCQCTSSAMTPSAGGLRCLWTSPLQPLGHECALRLQLFFLSSTKMKKLEILDDHALYLYLLSFCANRTLWCACCCKLKHRFVMILGGRLADVQVNVVTLVPTMCSGLSSRCHHVGLWPVRPFCNGASPRSKVLHSYRP